MENDRFRVTRAYPYLAASTQREAEGQTSDSLTTTTCACGRGQECLFAQPIQIAVHKRQALTPEVEQALVTIRTLLEKAAGLIVIVVSRRAVATLLDNIRSAYF